MAYSKISKDGRVCDLLENVEREKDVLIASAKAIYAESFELVKKYDEKNVRKLRKKLKVQYKNLQAINCFFKLRFPDEDDDSSSSAASLELKPDDPNCINYAELLIGSFPVCPGNKLLMKVSSFDSITDFWLQLSDPTERQALAMTISDKYDSEELETNFHPVPGLTVVARTPTGTVRALVLERDRKDRLFVRDLDSGIESYTSGKVFVPDVDLYGVPCQAVHCALHQSDELFYQPENISKGTLLSHELTVTFMDKLAENKFTVTVSCNAVLKPTLVHPVVPSQAALHQPFRGVTPTTFRESPLSGLMERVDKSASTCPSSTNPVAARSVRPEMIRSSLPPADQSFQRTPFSHTTFPNVVPRPSVTEAQERTSFSDSAFQNAIPQPEVEAKTPFSHTTTFPNAVPSPSVMEAQPVAHTSVRKPTVFEFAPIITSETSGSFNTTLKGLGTGNITASKPAAVNEKSKSKMNLTKKEGEQQHGSSASSNNSTNVFQEGNIFQVTVSHVESPSCIYVCFVNNETTKNCLLHEMNRVYNHPSRPDVFAEEGDFVAVHDTENDAWMRGKVIGLYYGDERSDDTVTAHLIDVGSTITVPENECAELVPKFKTPAKLAHAVRLDKVYPVPPQTDWSRQVLGELKELLKPVPVFTLTVISEANDREIPSVTLSPLSERDKVDINDLLVSLDLAVAQLPEEQQEAGWEPVTSMKAVTESWNLAAPVFQPNFQSGSSSSFKPESPLFEFGVTAEVATKEAAKSGRSSLTSTEDTPYVSVSPPEECATPPEIETDGWDSDEEPSEFNPLRQNFKNLARVNGTVNQAVLNSNPVDEDKNCYLFDRTGHCDRPGCTKIHTPLHTGGVALRSVPVVTQAFAKLKLPEIGKCFRFNVTEIKSVNRMFGILTSENVSKVEDPTSLGSITDLVQMINSRSETLEPMTTCPALGEIVLARYSATDLFYRAMVVDSIISDEPTNRPLSDQEALELTEVQVIYVDYGNASWIDMKNVRCIKSEFLHLPFMAVEITTKDMVAIKGCEQEAIQVLESLSQSTELSATCVGHEGGNLVVKDIHYMNTPLANLLDDLVITPRE